MDTDSKELLLLVISLSLSLKGVLGCPLLKHVYLNYPNNIITYNKLSTWIYCQNEQYELHICIIKREKKMLPCKNCQNNKKIVPGADAKDTSRIDVRIPVKITNCYILLFIISFFKFVFNHFYQIEEKYNSCRGIPPEKSCRPDSPRV